MPENYVSKKSNVKLTIKHKIMHTSHDYSQTYVKEILSVQVALQHTFYLEEVKVTDGIFI